MGHSGRTTIFILDYHGPDVQGLLGTSGAKRVHQPDNLNGPDCHNYWEIPNWALKDYLKRKNIRVTGKSIYNGGKEPILEIKDHDPNHA